MKKKCARHEKEGKKDERLDDSPFPVELLFCSSCCCLLDPCMRFENVAGNPAAVAAAAAAPGTEREVAERENDRRIEVCSCCCDYKLLLLNNILSFFCS